MNHSQQSTFKMGDRVTFKDGQRGTLVSNPEPGAMGWARFQATSGALFTVCTTGDEIKRTK